MPQGLLLGPLLFNIFINEIFLFVENTSICSYADDTTIYACNSDLEAIINGLEVDSSILLKWFSENYMQLNEKKCYFMIFGRAKVNIQLFLLLAPPSKKVKTKIFRALQFFWGHFIEHIFDCSQHCKALKWLGVHLAVSLPLLCQERLIED